MIELKNFLFFTVIILILRWTSCLFVLRNEITFDVNVTYASIGFEEITFFLRNTNNTNTNTVILFDFQTNASTILSNTASVKSNIIKSPAYHKNTPTNNIYAD